MFALFSVAVGIHESKDFNNEMDSDEQVVAVFKTLPTSCHYPLYRELFVKPLLHQTHRFYVKWSSNFLRDGDFSKYLEMVKNKSYFLYKYLN